MIFTPALQRWSPGHGKPCCCLFKATNMPEIFETTIRILLPKAAVSREDFPEVCVDPNTRSGAPGSVTGEKGKLKAERILNSADSITSYN